MKQRFILSHDTARQRAMSAVAAAKREELGGATIFGGK